MSAAVNLLDAEPMANEQAIVLVRRFREAKDAGMTRIEARLFAESEIDIGDLRRLVKLGWPPGLLAKVLL